MPNKNTQDTQDLIRWSKLTLSDNAAHFSLHTNSLPPRLSRDLTNMYMFSLYLNKQTHQVVGVYVCVFVRVDSLLLCWSI